MSSRKPLIVGIGGTTRIGSTTERALSVALKAVEAGGGETRLLGGEFLAKGVVVEHARAGNAALILRHGLVIEGAPQRAFHQAAQNAE